MKADVTGIEEYLASVERELKRRELKAQDLLNEYAERLKLEAQDRAPVNTGHLRDSITVVTTDANTKIVVAEADYAIYVEFGANGRPGRYFMSNAAVAVKREFILRLKSIWEDGE